MIQQEDNKTYGPYPLPEVYVLKDHAFTLREYYMSVSGDVYDRNPALFRRAMRFMQRNRDLQGEKHIFNKCFNSSRARIAYEYVVPIMLGGMSIPVMSVMGPTIAAIYSRPDVWVRMGSNWIAQALLQDGITEIDYVSVVAEGFTVGGSAISALIEIRPLAKDNPKITLGYIHKSVGETNVDIVMNGLMAGFFNGYTKTLTANVKVNDPIIRSLITGVGSGFYTEYKLIQTILTSEAKKKLPNKDEK